VARPTVLLFDIDGTLVTTGGVGRRAVERAFARQHGRPEACSQIRFDGMTDRSITRLGLQAIGVDPSDAAIDALLATYLTELRGELLLSTPESYRVHAGVLEALTAAAERGMALGLGTGNIEHGARLKLEHVGLYRHFSFGGFGSDHELRVELIRRGAERGAAQLGRPLVECRVLVIGDTPKDVDAARGIGAESLGVGTGSFSAQQLLAHGATYAFDDLAAPGALSAVLGDEHS
jgi:phosphoglycolate phosphatase-like HAD superfamily hydrolase